MRKLPIAAALALLATPALATSAQAQTALTTTTPGYTYFHQAGATMEAHDTAVQDCVRLAGGLKVTSSGGYNPIGAIMDNTSSGWAVASNVENCMVARGWQVRRIDPARGKTLAAASREGRHAQLAQWVGSVGPEGQVARRFANDLTDVRTVWQGRAWDGDTPSLSLTAQPKFDAEPPAPPKLPKLPKTAWPLAPLTPGQIAKLPPTASVIIVSLGKFEGGYMPAYVFNRAGRRPDRPAWVDGKPASFQFGMAGVFAPKAGVRVYLVEPGTWRLAGLFTDSGVTSFCLGAPSFTVGPGEAVYAGHFSLGDAGQAKPNLDMAPLADGLKSALDLLARVKPAAYVNGSVERCEGAYAYALEVEGAPFVDGYAGGSQALSGN